MRSATIPVDMQGTAPSGKTEEWKFTGSMEDLEALWSERESYASRLCQVSLSLTRTEGDMGELVVRHSYHLASSDGERLARDVGSSRDNPSYSYSRNDAQESIMLHPLIADAGLSADVLTVLNHIVKGGTEEDWIWLSDGGQHQCREYLYQQDPVNYGTLLKLAQTPSWLDVRITLRVTYSIPPDTVVEMPTWLKIVDEVPGPMPTPAGRNWLTGPMTWDVEGDQAKVSETYVLSGPHGWDEDIYGGGA